LANFYEDELGEISKTVFRLKAGIMNLWPVAHTYIGPPKFEMIFIEEGNYGQKERRGAGQGGGGACNTSSF
jgi:hypothetical protein